MCVCVCVCVCVSLCVTVWLSVCVISTAQTNEPIFIKKIQQTFFQLSLCNKNWNLLDSSIEIILFEIFDVLLVGLFYEIFKI